MDSIHDCVRRGAALLDQHLPEWWKKIDIDKLWMHNTCKCILGQCYGSFSEGKLALKLSQYSSSDSDNGFEVAINGDYRRLEAEWVRVITERQKETARA